MTRSLCIWQLALLACTCLSMRAAGESPVERTSVELAGPKAPVVELLNPGTIITDKPPTGWTHLVLKSQPSLSAEEQKKVGKTTADYATMIFTATAADVRQERPGDDFRLLRLGFGVGVNVKGQGDMVLSPDTERKLGANLSLIAGSVLAGVYDKQKLVRLVAATPYGALVDTPAFMPKSDAHAAVILRYVFLVDRKTGRLETLVWRIDLDKRGASEGVNGKIEWLLPNTQIDAAMKADLREFTLGVPSEKAFAVINVPSGRGKLTWPADMTGVAGKLKVTDAESQQLDGALRLLMQNAQTDPVYDRVLTPATQILR